jgi:hypothetical protein
MNTWHRVAEYGAARLWRPRAKVNRLAQGDVTLPLVQEIEGVDDINNHVNVQYRTCQAIEGYAIREAPTIDGSAQSLTSSACS